MKVNRKVVRMGIDIGKNTLHAVGVDSSEQVVWRRKFKRTEVLAYLANVPQCRIAMEACSGSNYWARVISELGHEVKLISPQYVKPYVKGNKNDYNDAEGIVEAMSRPTMRFVTPKNVAQQDLQALIGIRESVHKQRTAQSNQIRSLLLEYGLVIPKGVAAVRRRLPEILEDASNGLSDRCRAWLSDLREHLLVLDERLQHYDREIAQIRKAHEVCQRLETIPGVGPITSVAVAATLGDGKHFVSARHYAASLGLVPRQHTTGDQPRLLGISKRGDKRLRTLLIHGARAVIRHVDGKTDPLSRWIQQLVARCGIHKACVALANKNARMIFAIVRDNSTWRVPVEGV